MDRRPLDPDDCERMGWWPPEQDSDDAYETYRESEEYEHRND